MLAGQYRTTWLLAANRLAGSGTCSGWQSLHQLSRANVTVRMHLYRLLPDYPAAQMMRGPVLRSMPWLSRRRRSSGNSAPYILGKACYTLIWHRKFLTNHEPGDRMASRTFGCTHISTCHCGSDGLKGCTVATRHHHDNQHRSQLRERSDRSRSAILWHAIRALPLF